MHPFCLTNKKINTNNHLGKAVSCREHNIRKIDQFSAVTNGNRHTYTYCSVSFLLWELCWNPCLAGKQNISPTVSKSNSHVGKTSSKWKRCIKMAEETDGDWQTHRRQCLPWGLAEKTRSSLNPRDSKWPDMLNPVFQTGIHAATQGSVYAEGGR